MEAVDGDEVGLFVSYNPNEVGVMEERLYRNIPLDIDNMEGMHLNHISIVRVMLQIRSYYNNHLIINVIF